MINYSVVLRTLGFGGEKYKALLDSIKAQTVQPKEFLVIIPHGYDLPEERLGTETFIRGNKGMVRQRVDGINAAKGDYLLIIDDDIAFPNDFVENLYSLLTIAHADMVSPRVDDAAGNIGKAGLVSRIIAFLSSGSYFSHKKSDYAIRVSALGGSIHTVDLDNDKIYYTQTGHGGCCFVTREAVQLLHYEDESWLEEDVTYAYPDDQVFFYKAHLMGLKTAYAHKYPFRHLDSGATVNDTKISIDKRTVKKHDSSRNMFIFWYRFQYSRIKKNPWKKLVSLACIIWKVSFNMMLHLLLYGLRPYLWKCIAFTWRGYVDGYMFIKSDKYKNFISQ